MQQSENQPADIEIALWQYSESGGDWNRWMQSLSSDERGRAASYRFERDRASFIAGRYLLRQLLSLQTGISPSKVPLSPDRHGKLRLEGPDRPQFSLANADGLVAVAVASGCDYVGIDCERVDAEIEEAAMDSYCSADERRWLVELPASERARAAIALWTLKESHLKALGVGLREDPRNVAFSWRDGIPVMVEGGDRDRRWHHRLVESGSQHVVALAACSQSGLPGISTRLFQDDNMPSE
ncbi:4'-phosphopantetheinyl transferase superfamily protein (plasmid) [Rhizobium leguminosarum]|uniref:4'-phosphopantetheinyl transferase family protein n=1 Tax=Rhizobium TaxID=379 RepID=UPI00036014AF|nr:4'-phosphopantetheinyl transferase superfamily protein [Rhizobium leguminosarum]AVC46915.1 4'-phosphopantetheinyl transferase superfamily protein [Rhizobium leguminosarum bv. viciae]MBY5464130.1 4'-phosphopantetheinyl transferase superfamily protein [Rhizobium leguminosarum]MBY5528264.1 4'-phosphopantetheinyl transferase superfamily protein [Rhizobium leguminosarum]MBY5903365.1 4'-phosphopantetheinyl transferase superfamily protein [Rhizobium leguminosarum]MBY5910408.1 4'-phosphopantetheiny